MAHTTEIAWCDSTFNPWVGCTKVSPGCAHCYAERDFDLRKHVAKWGAGQPRHRTSEAYWRQPLRWDKQSSRDKHEFHATGAITDEDGEIIAADYRRPRVFCASLADWLDDEVPVEWLADLLDLIRRTPHLDWLLLTKRPQNWRKRIESIKTGSVELAAWLLGWLLGDGQFRGGRFDGLESSRAPANVWIGATVEDQARADERIPALLKIPARVRFLSCEPLLGPVDLSFGNPKWRTFDSYHAEIHWVICGGESGPKARPMHPDWARSLRDQCSAAGVPFLFKQWGEWLPINQMADGFCDRFYRSNREAKLHEDQAAVDEIDGRTCTVPSCVVHLDGSVHDPLKPMAFRQCTGAMSTFKVGKKAAGRLLDGREHNEFPLSR